jgi:uncharacterized protein YukE
MAGSNQQKFDFDQAKTLESKLMGEVGKIENTLNQTSKMVAGVRSWWTGGSEEGFINNFENTKKDVVKGLSQWLEEYKALIAKVAATKTEQDAALKNALNV